MNEVQSFCGCFLRSNNEMREMCICILAVCFKSICEQGSMSRVYIKIFKLLFNFIFLSHFHLYLFVTHCMLLTWKKTWQKSCNIPAIPLRTLQHKMYSYEHKTIKYFLRFPFVLFDFIGYRFHIAFPKTFPSHLLILFLLYILFLSSSTRLKETVRKKAQGTSQRIWVLPNRWLI